MNSPKGGFPLGLINQAGDLGLKGLGELGVREEPTILQAKNEKNDGKKACSFRK